MEGFRSIFQGVEDLCKSKAKKHDLTEMLVIALLATLSGRWSKRCSSLRRKSRRSEEAGALWPKRTGSTPRTCRRPINMTHLDSAFRPLAACCRVAESSAEPDNPQSKCRIPEVESSTALRNP